MKMKNLKPSNILVLFLLIAQVISSQNLTRKILNRYENNNFTQCADKESGTRFLKTDSSIGVTTTFDYFANSIIRDQITNFNDFPYLSNMVEPFFGNLFRGVMFSFLVGSDWQNYPVSQLMSGWPQIDVSLTGDSIGTIGVSVSSPPSLYIYEVGGNFRSSPYGASSGSSFQFAGNNIFLGGSDGSDITFYKSSDFGYTYSEWAKLINFPVYYTTSGSEVDMFKSPDEENIVYAGTVTGDGEIYNGVPEDHADNVWCVYSTDQGETWNGESIGFDGDINSVTGYHTANFAPVFENFGQVDGAVGNNGIIHIVANGYGPVFDSPSGGNIIGYSFPVLYWNSSSRQWISISDISIDTIQSVIDYYPGNDLGQSYPGISVSVDGQTLIVTWTGPQLNSSGHIDTLNGNGYYWTDIYFAYSLNGGDNWTYGGALSDKTDVSESFAHPSQHIRVDENNHLIADIVYLADLSPGVFGLGEGNETNNPIMYLTYDLGAISLAESVNPEIKSFELFQNYPNPFNPVTSIRYAVGSRQYVSIKVYDVLGNEVATLVNEEKPGGSYKVKFDGSNLASGIYICQLKCGSTIQLKKMILLK